MTNARQLQKAYLFTATFKEALIEGELVQVDVLEHMMHLIVRLGEGF